MPAEATQWQWQRGWQGGSDRNKRASGQAEALKQNEGGATALTATAESKHGEWWQVELKTRDPRQPRIPGDQQRWSHRNLQRTDEWPKWSCGSALAVGMASWRVGTGQSAGPM